MKKLDLLIIGAGTAGLSAAKEAAKYTDNFAVVESGPIGTLCARSGCMPSKALIEVANSYHTRSKFKNFGIRGEENLSVNIPAVMEHVRSLRDHFVEGVKNSMEKYEIILGKGSLVEANVVEVEGRRYQADAIIICTGSTPRIPEEFSSIGDGLLTTDTLFEQKTLPDSIAVIGLGSVGVEMGQALARLGIRITGYNRGTHLANIEDPEIAKVAKKLLGEEMTLHLGAEIATAEKIDSGYRLTCEGESVEVDQILVSAGRVPNLQGLGLKEIGVPFNDGVPEFDPDTLQIKGQPIYIAGDVNADRAIQHEAADEGKIAVQNALGVAEKQQRRVALTITFTDPPIVKVGKSYSEIKNDNPIVGEISYQNQGRARLKDEAHGMVRLYASQDDLLLGGEIMAPAADHFGYILALAVQEKLSLQSLLQLPYYHPVLEEGLRTALGKMEKQVKQAA